MPKATFQDAQNRDEYLIQHVGLDQHAVYVYCHQCRIPYIVSGQHLMAERADLTEPQNRCRLARLEGFLEGVSTGLSIGDRRVITIPPNHYFATAVREVMEQHGFSMNPCFCPNCQGKETLV